ncbi:MAG: hypothetical protein DI587_14665 [Variovorax paradoxus]|nr:MAG: hypothetical protein DI583_14665 [Variovorax paradoxus]PZQ09652.1 MAG: hypothetical protein DI587_14665 [Variovorax paradoxus]
MCRRSFSAVLGAVLLPLVAWAVMVTAEQIVAAVRAAPNATQWLRANAEAVANLAIRVESNGNTQAYNGSCCYGVLQMTRSNIRAYTDLTPEQYRQASLQTQINAWVELTADALRARAPQTLAGMDTFDGRAADAYLVLACVQLGIGNCQRMINSGSCSGFADSNGTTICSMADRLAGVTPNPGTGPDPTNPGGPGSPGPGTVSAPVPVYVPSCIQDGYGGCVSITQAINQGFAQGSGASMSDMKRLIYAIVATSIALVLLSASRTTWRMFSKGRLPAASLLVSWKGAAVAMTVLLVTLTLL